MGVFWHLWLPNTKKFRKFSRFYIRFLRVTKILEVCLIFLIQYLILKEIWLSCHMDNLNSCYVTKNLGGKKTTAWFPRWFRLIKPWVSWFGENKSVAATVYMGAAQLPNFTRYLVQTWWVAQCRCFSLWLVLCFFFLTGNLMFCCRQLWYKVLQSAQFVWNI